VWRTFPLIVLLFTLAPLGYSKHVHSSGGKITHARVVEVFPDLQQQIVYQAYGMVLESGTHEFQAVPADSYMTKSGRAMTGKPDPYTFSQDPPYSLVNERVKDWTFRIFDAVKSVPAEPTVDVEAARSGNTVSGRVTNRTDFTIRESFYFYTAAHTVSLGTLAPGQSRPFTLDLLRLSQVPFAEYQLRDLLNMHSLSHADPHFFFGVLEDPPGQIRINGNVHRTVRRQYMAVFGDVQE